ncbi:hypothetical protein LX32DRAFT_220273 [Colletotrichum zoysiae]|uniref:Uncharacterized protein n=1 Tax=Colletotrichum zoysiae TaxID=1216348 RepID=A0AAD9HN94_9PEZI|nr:hypothetical protein LX32DRAFT_220273 [Colletotrichum zoysiae]
MKCSETTLRGGKAPHAVAPGCSNTRTRPSWLAGRPVVGVCQSKPPWSDQARKVTLTRGGGQIDGDLPLFGLDVVSFPPGIITRRIGKADGGAGRRSETKKKKVSSQITLFIIVRPPLCKEPRKVCSIFRIDFEFFLPPGKSQTGGRRTLQRMISSAFPSCRRRRRNSVPSTTHDDDEDDDPP